MVVHTLTDLAPLFEALGGPQGMGLDITRRPVPMWTEELDRLEEMRRLQEEEEGGDEWWTVPRSQDEVFAMLHSLDDSELERFANAHPWHVMNSSEPCEALVEVRHPPYHFQKLARVKVVFVGALIVFLPSTWRKKGGITSIEVPHFPSRKCCERLKKSMAQHGLAEALSHFVNQRGPLTPARRKRGVRRGAGGASRTAAADDQG